MSLLASMGSIASECARTPGRPSLWSDRLGRYVCGRDPEFFAVAAEAAQKPATRPPIGEMFKLVFLTAAGGTLLFVVICVTTTLLTGHNPPPLLEKTIASLFDLAKIGFGAICGMLGGAALNR